MAKEWLTAADIPQRGYYDESGFVSEDGGISSSLAALDQWVRVAPQLGFQGQIEDSQVGPDGNVYPSFTNEFVNFVQQKKNEGYDFVIKAGDIDRKYKTFGFKLPTGEVINQQVTKTGGFGDFIKGFVLPAVGSYFGAQFLGNALAGAGGAGAGAAGVGAGIAEGMAPGVLAPASAAELAAVNALTTVPAVAGVAEGMVPGGLTPQGIPVTPQEVAATQQIMATPFVPPTPTPSAGVPAASTAANAAKAAMDTSSIWGPLITSLASLYGGSQAAQASERAAEITGAAANRAIDLQERMYREGLERQQPFYQAGVNALTQLQQRTGAMPPAFTGQVDLTRDPGYAFRLSEGLKGLERSAAARGGLMSGATGKALTRFGQEAASQEYQNAYNRALTEYNALRQRESEEYNRLSGLAGTGGTTAQQIGVAGQQMASNVGNIGMQQGTTQGNALMAGAAARQSAYGNVGKAWGDYFAPQPVINYLGGRP